MQIFNVERLTKLTQEVSEQDGVEQQSALAVLRNRVTALEASHRQPHDVQLEQRVSTQAWPCSLTNYGHSDYILSFSRFSDLRSRFIIRVGSPT